MRKRFWQATVVSLAMMSLALSACQPMPATVAPAASPAQATAAPTTASMAQPSPTATTPQVLWAFRTQGAIWGTATVSEGTVYFGSDDGHLYALAAESGEPRWQFATEGIVRSQPAIAGGLVYVASDDGHLYAVDAQNGQQVWRTDIGNTTTREVRARIGNSPSPTGYDYRQSSPIVAESQVYVGSADGNVYALAADTGRIIWTFRTGERVRATPTVDNGTVYIGSWDKFLYALGAVTGQMRWKTLLSGQVQTTALVADGVVYCASRKASVVALDAQTGQITWEYSYGSNMWVESSPRLHNGIVYIGSSGSQMIVGLHSQTGEIFTGFFSDLYYWSTPAIVGDTLCIGATSGQDKGGLLAFRLADGKFSRLEQDRWGLPVKGNLEISGQWSGVAASPVVVDGAIYFGGLDGRFYAVRA